MLLVTGCTSLHPGLLCKVRIMLLPVPWGVTIRTERARPYAPCAWPALRKHQLRRAGLTPLVSPALPHCAGGKLRHYSSPAAQLHTPSCAYPPGLSHPCSVASAALSLASVSGVCCCPAQLHNWPGRVLFKMHFLLFLNQNVSIILHMCVLFNLFKEHT